jgi:8-oxo-dGTP pyrophosphatase MutT (NUDIX family)
MRSLLESAVLRETYEETGLFFSDRPLLESEKLDQIAKIRLDYIVNSFHGAAGAKQTSYEQLSELLSPTQKMVPFIRMITVPFLKSRYDTTFFVLPLEPHHFLNFSKYT